MIRSTLSRLKHVSQTPRDITPPHALIIGGHTDIGHLVIESFRKRGFALTLTSSRFLENPLPAELAKDIPYHHLDLNAVIEDGHDVFRKTYTHIICLAPLHICERVLGFINMKRECLQRIIFISSQNVNLGISTPTYDKIREMEARIHKTDLPFIILRPTMLIGRKDKTLYRLSEFGRRFRVLPRIGHADSLQQPLDYRDLAQAIQQASHADIPLRKSYGLGGPEFMSLKRLYKRISRHIAGPVIVLPIPTAAMKILLKISQKTNTRLPFDKEQIARAHKDKHCTDAVLPIWKPRFSLEESLDHTAASHHIST